MQIHKAEECTVKRLCIHIYIYKDKNERDLILHLCFSPENLIFCWNDSFGWVLFMIPDTPRNILSCFVHISKKNISISFVTD